MTRLLLLLELNRVPVLVIDGFLLLCRDHIFVVVVPERLHGRVLLVGLTDIPIIHRRGRLVDHLGVVPLRIVLKAALLLLRSVLWGLLNVELLVEVRGVDQFRILTRFFHLRRLLEMVLSARLFKAILLALGIVELI